MDKAEIQNNNWKIQGKWNLENETDNDHRRPG